MNIASVEQSEARGASARCSQNPMKNRVFFIESEAINPIKIGNRIFDFYTYEFREFGQGTK